MPKFFGDQIHEKKKDFRGKCCVKQSVPPPRPTMQCKPDSRGISLSISLQYSGYMGLDAANVIGFHCIFQSHLQLGSIAECLWWHITLEKVNKSLFVDIEIRINYDTFLLNHLNIISTATLVKFAHLYCIIQCCTIDGSSIYTVLYFKHIFHLYTVLYIQYIFHLSYIGKHMGA